MTICGSGQPPRRSDRTPRSTTTGSTRTRSRRSCSRPPGRRRTRTKSQFGDRLVASLKHSSRRHPRTELHQYPSLQGQRSVQLPRKSRKPRNEQSRRELRRRSQAARRSNSSSLHRRLRYLRRLRVRNRLQRTLPSATPTNDAASSPLISPVSVGVGAHARWAIIDNISTMAKQAKGIRGKSKALHAKFAKGSKSNSSNNPDRVIKGNSSGVGNTFRTKNTIKRLKMYDQKMPDMEKMHQRPTEAARVDPNRKWFGNVRTIDQKALERLRIEMARKQEDPTKIFVKAKKIPTSLLEEPVRENKLRLLEVETYESTFGPNSRRKRVKLSLGNMEELVEAAEGKEYDLEKDVDNLRNREDWERPQNRDKRMSAGQSKRIWDELHKVVDSSDVLVQVLDARDPEGTRSLALEEHLRKNFPHKHMVLLLNKADLVPLWVVARWVKHLARSYPTIAYRSSIANPFGKGSLINLFRQFDIFHRDKKNISIGFVGYPNVGKSSVINSLKEKRVCKAAPVPGETKVWQYVTLTKRIYLIDCPGTVHVSEGKDDVESVLKGCVRAEKIDQPTYYIPHILEKVKRRELLTKMYGVERWEDAEDFLKQLATRKGKLRRGGEPDVDATAKIVLIDWQRGEIPYFHLPDGEVDKFEPKQEQTIDNVKEEDFLQMVGAPAVQLEEEGEEEEGEEEH